MPSYWIAGLRSTLKSITHKCFICRKLRANPLNPLMSDLPAGRLAYQQRPFTHCGIDYFGPMIIRIGRRQEKRWGVIFTCLSTRAIHLELAHSLSTDSAIMALERMALREYSTLKHFEWKFNPPCAPHMGGVWERLIRSVKVTLNAILYEQVSREEVLVTILAEVEHIINSRPLTKVSNDPRDCEALTPNHFLIGSPSVSVNFHGHTAIHFILGNNGAWHNTLPISFGLVG